MIQLTYRNATPNDLEAIVEIYNSINFINTSSNASSFLWDFGDSTTSSQINPNHIYDSLGIYTVQLTAINNSLCDNWIEKRHYINVIDPLSLNENFSNQTKISIIPNPSNGFITIHLKNNNENLEFILFDIVGNEVERYLFSNGAILNISELSGGYYLFSIFDEQRKLGNGKFVKL